MRRPRRSDPDGVRPGGVDRPDPTRARELRSSMNLPELILWRALRGGKLEGLRFRRQHPMLEYVLDFYCADRKLAVEVDGRGHDHPEQAAHDRRRDARLAELGVLTLRFAAKDVLAGDDPVGVLERIAATARGRPSVSAGAGARTRPPLSG